MFNVRSVYNIIIIIELYKFTYTIRRDMIIIILTRYPLNVHRELFTTPRIETYNIHFDTMTGAIIMQMYIVQLYI